MSSNTVYRRNSVFSKAVSEVSLQLGKVPTGIVQSHRWPLSRCGSSKQATVEHR